MKTENNYNNIYTDSIYISGDENIQGSRNYTIKLANAADLNLVKTFECGQCFRWNRVDASASKMEPGTLSAAEGTGTVAENTGGGSAPTHISSTIIYKGIAGDYPAVILEKDGQVYVSSAASLGFWRSYFDLDTDYSAANERFEQIPWLDRCTRYGKGIRILRQDPWEALCSFIISQCNNIPRIKGIIERLCEMYGEKVEIPVSGRINAAGESLIGKCGLEKSAAAEPCGYEKPTARKSCGFSYKFPKPEALAELTPDDLAPLRSGYRAPYIIGAARAVCDGSLDLDALTKTDFETAKKTLKSLNGIGDKVANCAVLFGLHHMEAFPVDVWIKKSLKEHFPPDFDPASLGPMAGLAQQYLFYYEREGTP